MDKNSSESDKEMLSDDPDSEDNQVDTKFTIEIDLKALGKVEDDEEVKDDCMESSDLSNPNVKVIVDQEAEKKARTDN